MARPHTPLSFAPDLSYIAGRRGGINKLQSSFISNFLQNIKPGNGLNVLDPKI